jgi:hypothetical protein
MSRLGSRTFILARNAFLASSVVAAAAGCTGALYARSPSVEGPPVVEDDSEVVYAEAPPVVDIETYPAVMYGGVYVYYVDGRWYQRGPRGWGYYRQEPPELGRQRQEHLQRDHDPRWAAQRAPDRRGQDERVAPPPAPRPGVAEAQPPDRRAQSEQPRRESVPRPQQVQQPRRENIPAPEQAQQPRRESVQTPAPPPQTQRRDQAPSPRPAKAPVKSAPVHPTERQPERR